MQTLQYFKLKFDEVIMSFIDPPPDGLPSLHKQLWHHFLEAVRVPSEYFDAPQSGHIQSYRAAGVISRKQADEELDRIFYVKPDVIDVTATLIESVPEKPSNADDGNQTQV